MVAEQLASRSIVGVGLAVEASAVDHFYLDVFEAGVARHEGVRGIIEASRGRVHEGVVDEPGAVGIGNPHALTTASDGVSLEPVVLGPRGAGRLGHVVPPV